MTNRTRCIRCGIEETLVIGAPKTAKIMNKELPTLHTRSVRQCLSDVGVWLRGFSFDSEMPDHVCSEAKSWADEILLSLGNEPLDEVRITRAELNTLLVGLLVGAQEIESALVREGITFGGDDDAEKKLIEAFRVIGNKPLVANSLKSKVVKAVLFLETGESE